LNFGGFEGFDGIFLPAWSLAGVGFEGAKRTQVYNSTPLALCEHFEGFEGVFQGHKQMHLSEAKLSVGY
jgi:hypothetical protein